MRTREQINADMKSAMDKLRTLTENGVTGDNRSEVKELNGTLKTLRTEQEELMAAAEAEKRQKAEDAELERRTKELLAQPRSTEPAKPSEAATRAAAADGKTREDAMPTWLRDFYEGPTQGDFDRAAENAEDVTELREYCRTGVIPDDAQQRALAVGADASGGYLVPENTSFMNRVVMSMKAFEGVERVATIVTTNTGAPLPIPTLNDTANDGENVAEGAASGTQTDPAFGEATLDVDKITSGPIEMSTELIQDSGPAAETLLGRIIGQRIGRQAGSRYATAADATGKFKSLVNQATLGNTVKPVWDLSDAGYTAAIPASGLAAACVRAVSIYYRRMVDASVLIADDFLNDLQTARGTDGHLVYPYLAFVGPDQVRTLQGMRLVIEPNYASKPTAAGTWVAATVGDHSAVYIRRVRGLRIFRNPFINSAKDQVTFQGWIRAGMALTDALAVKRFEITVAA